MFNWCQQAGKKILNGVFGNATALIKSTILSLTLWEVGSGVVSFFESDESLSSQKDCEDYHIAKTTLIATTTFVTAASLLLFYAKKSQTQASPGETQSTLENDPILPTASASKLEKCRIFSKDTSKTCFLGFFTVADSLLNARAFLGLTPWAGLNWPLCIVSFILFMNQNIRYSHKVNSGEYYSFHKSKVGITLDLLAITARVAAAKISLYGLIEEFGFNKGVEIALKTLGIAEPSLFFSKWSNYQSVSKRDEEDFSKTKLFFAFVIDIFYAMQDSVLYMHGAKESSLVNKYIFECNEKIYAIFALSFAVCEALAYGSKYYDAVDSQEVESVYNELGEKAGNLKDYFSENCCRSKTYALVN